MLCFMDKQDLFNTIVSPVLYEDGSPYKLMVGKLNDIDIDYFQDSVPLGRTVDADMEMNVKNSILNDFVSYGNEIISENAASVERKIVEDVGILLLGYNNRSEGLNNLDAALGMIHRFVRKQLCFVPVPKHSKSELQKMYHDAEKVTTFEWLTGSNDKDVIKYYHALIEHTVWSCRLLLRRRVGQYLMHIVDVLSRKYDLKSRWATSYNDEPSHPLDANLPDALEPLVEAMAENVHNVWMQGRLAQGWTWGTERSDLRKEHPCLVPYQELPDEEKEYDRRTAKATIAFILSQGYKISRSAN